MKRINARQLNREFKKITENLPVIITVRGEDKYILSDINPKTEPEPKEETKEELEEETEEVPEEAPAEVPAQVPKQVSAQDEEEEEELPSPTFDDNLKKSKLEEIEKKTKEAMNKKPVAGPKKYSKLNITKKAEDFCPKHGGRLIGSQYTCGCIKK